MRLVGNLEQSVNETERTAEVRKEEEEESDFPLSREAKKVVASVSLLRWEVQAAAARKFSLASFCAGSMEADSFPCVSASTREQNSRGGDSGVADTLFQNF